MWSGFTALWDASQGSRLGNANPALYQIAAGSGYTSAFNDSTSGSNGAFSAGPGHDEVTGLGPEAPADLIMVRFTEVSRWCRLPA